MLPWQQHSRYHSMSFVMYICAAKFEEHCSNISGDILDSVFYCLRWLNTVFARAFADAIQYTHNDFKNKHTVFRAIILFTQHQRYLCYFSLELNAVY